MMCGKMSEGCNCGLSVVEQVFWLRVNESTNVRIVTQTKDSSQHCGEGKALCI
jgi:hypothetical protein